MTEERKRISVSIHDLIRTILRLLPVIICWSLLCCMLLYAYKIIYKKPVYSAEAAIYVLSRTADSDYGRLDVSDLDVSRQMTLDALSILGSEQMAEEVLVNLRGDAAELKTMSAAELLSMVQIHTQDDSLEISIVVNGPDPYVVCEIANVYKETAIRELSDRIMAKGIQTIRNAMIPLWPSERSASFYGTVGLLLGLISSVGMITVVHIFRHAKSEPEDVGEI